MSTRERVLVCLCTYNELANLPTLLPAIWQQLPPADVLVVDDNSPDGTGRWCDQLAQYEPRLKVLHRAGKLGLGSATAEGMRVAIHQDYTWLITMDADFSHPPEVLPQLLDQVDVPNDSGRPADRPIDVVVASRYVPGGGVVGWPWRRRWMSRWVNWLARTVLRIPVRDTSGAFRCYRVSLLSPLLAGPLHATGYAFFEEVLWRLARQGARFREVPYTFRDRTAGRSKLNLREAVRALRLILWLGGVERGWYADQRAPGSVR